MLCHVYFVTNSFGNVPPATAYICLHRHTSAVVLVLVLPVYAVMNQQLQSTIAIGPIPALASGMAIIMLANEDCNCELAIAT
jgi:hypothetical protein